MPNQSQRNQVSNPPCRPVPAGGDCLHECRVALGVPGVNGAVVPGQRNLPQLVCVVTLGQEVQEAGLLAGI